MTCLSFTIVVGPRRHSHYQVRVPRDSWPYFIVSDPRLPQPGGPVILPGTGFPFRRLLRLAGLRWRYSIRAYGPPQFVTRICVCWHEQDNYIVVFEVFTARSMKKTIRCYMAPCNLVEK
jgi:hypothetical protein